MNILPINFSLKDLMSPIEDQENIGSCTAQAFVGAIEYYMKKQNITTDFSRLYLYYHSRSDDSKGIDSGAYLGNVATAINQYGIIPESIWPYCPELVFMKPPTLFNYLGKHNNRESSNIFKDLPYNRDSFKKELVAGNPIVFGTPIFNSMIIAYKNGGYIPIPKTGDEYYGGHAMLIVGYDDEKEYEYADKKYKGFWIIRNSWGSSNADKGYYYLPYQYFDTTLNVNSTTYLVCSESEKDSFELTLCREKSYCIGDECIMDGILDISDNIPCRPVFEAMLKIKMIEGKIYNHIFDTENSALTKREILLIISAIVFGTVLGIKNYNQTGLISCGVISSLIISIYISTR